MRISYNWLQEYLPEIIEPEKLSNILTSIGLEVENLERFEEIAGSFKGLIAGEVIACEKHTGAAKLKLTRVDTGNGQTLQIVCGADNVAIGQKVVVAPVGTIIHPFNNEPILIKQVKIRGIESFGMLCAEDEIGISSDHSGIIVLPSHVEKGSLITDHFKSPGDWIFVIGLTPNRIDAMSHLGVAKDVCAFLSHQQKKDVAVRSPFNDNFKVDNHNLTIDIIVENPGACPRYAGVTFTNVKVDSSPVWLQVRLKSIGLRPVNNIVDITNYILHESGQPLHAFDSTTIKDNKIIVKNLPGGTSFITLDEKERKLHEEDLMICNGEDEPMCFGGVYGGVHSGISPSTTSIFLESAWFDPLSIRKTSVRHNLRTDAAIRFEKGTDIGNTVNVLKRASLLIKEIASGEISSDIIDVYTVPKTKTTIQLNNDYLKKISGKNYPADTVKNILLSLGFEILHESTDHFIIAVPFSKPDVFLQADVIEEIMRIDGFDNIEIPVGILISPVTDHTIIERACMEKAAGYLVANGFSEIFTNSITNSAYFDERTLKDAVKILNSLSVELDIMRPGLLQTGLECISYNVNRKNNNLLLFEFGKSYSALADYKQSEHLCLYLSGNKNEAGWRTKGTRPDIYFVKGVCDKLFSLCGLKVNFSGGENKNGAQCINITAGGETVGNIINVGKEQLDRFSIKQPVLFADIFWDGMMTLVKEINIEFKDIAKFPMVHRDLSIIVDKKILYSNVEEAARLAKVSRLVEIKLFDVFENEKLGKNKKSFAISLTFSDADKTLTDKETDQMINDLIKSFVKELGAQIRTAT
jgi:phenylalanyl-tRNA synthetase beta chain